MRVPLSWIKEFVDVEDTPEGLRDRLTFSGLEVEGMEHIGASYEGLVVAEIKAVARHPDADRLTVCTVFDGQQDVQVVCGAPNVRPGMRSILAPVGTVLPGGLKMKRAKIRGVESFGMLCAEDELAISKAHDGIVDLPETLAPGTPAASVLPAPDLVFELEVTPNRPDCLSIFGIAREIAALYGLPLRMPDMTINEDSSLAPVSERVTVTVDPSAGNTRYTARLLEGVTVGPSPEWMKDRLAKCGIRSINNVVDITNYVLLELGQPLHAFDLRQIAGQAIGVRTARDSEGLTTLDGRDRVLEPHHLVISDAEKAVALAGVMGGANSEVVDDTTSVLLESAFFPPSGIRRTARELDLHSEASYRFARGVDAGGVECASRRAAHLLVHHADARLSPGVVDRWPEPWAERKISIRWQTFTAVTGVDTTPSAIRSCLESISLRVSDVDAETASCLIPSFRADLEREIDLVEEFARLYGLDRIPVPAPQVTLIDQDIPDEYGALRRVRGALEAMGLRQAVHYSLTAPALLELLDPANAPTRVVIPNPISQDQAVLRSSLIPQMVETLGHNRARQVSDVAFYEVGKIFSRTQRGEAGDRHALCIGMMGPAGRPPLDRQRPVTPAEMVAWLKGCIDALGAHLGLTLQATACRAAPFAPGQVALLSRAEKTVGVFGVLDPKIAREWRFSGPVGLVHVELDALVSHNRALPKAVTPPAHPSNARDTAFLVPASVTHARIMELVAKYGDPLLESTELFDVFSGTQTGPDRKSMAYRFVYRHAEKSLTDEAVNSVHERLKATLCNDLPATVMS